MLLINYDNDTASMLENILNNSTIRTALRVALTLVATIIIARLFSFAWRKWSSNTIHHKFIGNIFSGFITMGGIIIALRWIDVLSTVAAALLAGSGILAITIGLAAQESLGNAFNGLFISISKPFEVGDRVHLINADITGFIEDITVRHTVIRTFTNSRIIVPNSIMNRELIENSNFCNPLASQFIDVIITYDSNVDDAREIMAQVIGNHPDFVDTRTDENKTAPKVPVFVRALGLQGIELRASMWTATVGVNFAACSGARRELLQAFQEADIKLAQFALVNMH